MLLDYAENVFQLMTGMAALLLCLVRWISQKRREWLYAVGFFLCFLLGTYYWTGYLVIWGQDPDSTGIWAYIGCNIAFAILLVLGFRLKSPAERRYFHPLMLLPIPLNIWQLTLYLPFGGEVNSIFQVTACTAIACSALQSLCWWYFRNRKAKRPLFAAASLLFVCFEFGMWTSTCFDAPVASLYYPFSFLCSVDLVFLAWALYRALTPDTDREDAREEGDEKPKLRGKSRSNLLAPMILIFFLMMLMVLYTSQVIRRVATANLREMGEARIASVTARMENYLEMTKSVMWVTADTVDHMSRNGKSAQDILKYITEESEKQEKHFDENYSGIYGYVLGEYLDGDGWVPPEDFDPTRRDWYLAAIEAQGEATIVSPYVDAQTGAVIISISRMLSNGRDVLSLDVTMNHIQEIVADLQIKEKGYGFVVNRDEMLIAHQDESLKGRYLNQTESERALMTRIAEVQDGTFEIDLDGKESTAFVHQILGQWYAVILVTNTELYEEVWQQLTVNVLISMVIFALIALFYLLGYRNEQTYSRRIEQMRSEEQRQAFEAHALKMEKEAADRANQAKSDFLAEMSHEIRTPINAVLGMNEMILRESAQTQSADSPDIHAFIRAIAGYARNIESAGSNLLAIINDILDLSKIEAGKMDIVEGKYHLCSIVNDLSNMAWFKAKEKGLDFIVDVDETLPDELFGDKVRVRQIITNLLNNSIKYTEHGYVRLSLRGEIQGATEPGQIIRLAVSVEDTGIGIRKEDIDKLFTKFQRLDLKQNGTVEGTGLGLAITHNLLDMMGGSIEVHSEYGRGSVFTAIIPQRIVSVEPVGDFRSRFQRNMPETEAYRETFRAPDANILIVDDTRMNLTVAVGLLKGTEIQIDTALGGEEAIKLAQEKAYDVILMDQRMPRMDGTEALRLIRAQSGGANRETPVICLTADAVIGAKERYMAEGFTDYLTKPIDSKALEMMLVKYLPGEKVQFKRGEQQAGDERQGGGGEREAPFASLKAAGIDTQTGLCYCQGDRNMYVSLLREYAQSATEKMRELQKAYEAQDWKNYAVYVHSLKSASRMIGATELSEAAAKLEAAADRAQADVIQSGHDGAIQLYISIVDAIRQATDTEDSAEARNADGEILEFLPEQSGSDENDVI